MRSVLLPMMLFIVKELLLVSYVHYDEVYYQPSVLNLYRIFDFVLYCLVEGREKGLKR